MKIRRYLGSNTQEAILKVKMDLGNDALILNTKRVRQKGILKLFSKPMVEVLAAVDENKSEGTGKMSSREDNRNTYKADTAGKNPNSVNSVVHAAKEEKLTQLESKVNNMESILHKIYDRMSSASKGEKQVYKEEADEDLGYVQLFHNNLLKNDVETEVVKAIISKIHEKSKTSSGSSDITSIVYNVIASMLGTPQPIKLSNNGKPTIVILIGPTGVGKTTTLAKLAANFTLNQKKSVGLLTTDTYRVSAVDQLKTYAEIMGTPLTVIYSIEEAVSAIENYSDKDLILIDTAGRSYKDKSQFVELEKLIDIAGTEEIYLVLSATTSNKTVSEILANYSFLSSYKLIFTKIDESATSGVVMNARYLTNKPISYIAIGQSVPDDIELADINKITKNLMGSLK